MAEQILALAAAQQIPVGEDSELAQLLSSVKLAGSVPPDVLVTLAALVTFICRADTTIAEAG